MTEGWWWGRIRVGGTAAEGSHAVSTGVGGLRGGGDGLLGWGAKERLRRRLGVEEAGMVPMRRGRRALSQVLCVRSDQCLRLCSVLIPWNIA